MIEVLVHSCAPFVRGDCAKKRMRMFCASRFPALVKLPDANFELFLFEAKIPRIRDHETLIGRAVSGKRPIVGEKRPHESSDHPAYEDARTHKPSGSQIKRCRTMRHHLRNIHFAPLPLGCRLQFVDTCDHFVDCIRQEEIFHNEGNASRPVPRIIADGRGRPSLHSPIAYQQIPRYVRAPSGRRALSRWMRSITICSGRRYLAS
jgi:hypothetical protein